MYIRKQVQVSTSWERTTSA